MARIVVVVPCYNEASRLDTAAFVRFVRGTSEVEFLFVDDGSTDATMELLKQICKASPTRLAFMCLPANRGKAEAVRQGVLTALNTGAAYVGYWDADLATPLEAIHTFARVLDRAPRIELVMGSRVQLLGRRIERHASRHYLGRIFATTASFALGLRVYDTQCGAKLFRSTPEMAALFEAPFRSRWIFDVELLARLMDGRRGGAPAPEQIIYEEPLTDWSDVGGSKLKAKDFVTAFFELARIYVSARTSRSAHHTEAELHTEAAAPGAR